jgi:UDP-GlcNAc:undecaprenyl-phosphate GlcNAc-1-phosphate transferase
MTNLYIFLLLFNLIFIYYFKNISRYINLFDKPDQLRKFHKKKIANIGGLFIFFNLFFFIIYFLFNNNYFDNHNFALTKKEIYIFFIFSSLFFLIGFLDDKHELSPNLKLMLFSSVVGFLLFSENNILITEIKFSFLLQPIDISKISVLFTSVSFLLFINAFNMFDGINLQSALYSLFLLFIFLTIGFAVEIIIVLILSLIFFIYLNYKNKCFLGDNGSLIIAFILSFLFIKSYNSNYIVYADQIFLLMMIPGIDLLRLAITRIYNGKHPFRGDRDHFHHNILAKYGYNKTVLITFLIIVVPNIISLTLGWTLYLILLSGLLYSILLFNIKK